MENDSQYVDRLKESGLDVHEITDRTILLSYEEAMAKLKHSAVKAASKSDRCKSLLEQLRGFVKSSIAKDQSLIQLALKAYHSTISSYASYSLRDKKIFNYKELNFTDLAKGFGIAKEWAMAEKKKRAFVQSLDRPRQYHKSGEEEGEGREENKEPMTRHENRPAGNAGKMIDLAQMKSQKMEEVIRRMNKRQASSLDF